MPACRYAVHKQMLSLPMLDPTVPEAKLADWIHARTMRVHGFLDDQVCNCQAREAWWKVMHAPSRTALTSIWTRQSGYTAGAWLMTCKVRTPVCAYPALEASQRVMQAVSRALCFG